MLSALLILILIIMVLSDRDRALYYYHKMSSGSAEMKAFQTQQIIKQMQAGGITQDDIAHALVATSQDKTAHSGANNVMPRLFAILGGIFVLAGVGTYIGMFWDSMPSIARIIITLGLGIALTLFGFVAIREDKYPRIIIPVFIAASIACVTGGFVLLHEMFPSSNEPQKAMLMVFTCMTLYQLFVYRFFTHTITIALAIFYLYGALGAAFDLMDISTRWSALVLGGSLMLGAQGLAKSPHRSLVPLCIIISAIWFNIGIYDWVDEMLGNDWAILVVGLSVFALGFGLSLAAETGIIGVFYFIGSVMVLSGMFDMLKHTPYDLLLLLLSMGLVYVSILLKSRAILLTSTLSILSFIGYYANRYFVDSVGLPVALIIAGFVFIGISAGALKIKNKYF